jgi:hypothetical protein
VFFALICGSKSDFLLAEPVPDLQKVDSVLANQAKLRHYGRG